MTEYNYLKVSEKAPGEINILYDGDWTIGLDAMNSIKEY
jgi:hypothetical protein